VVKVAIEQDENAGFAYISLITIKHLMKGLIMQAHMTEKCEAAKLLAQLPEDSTLEDIQYHLYVLEKIKHGQADVAMGKTYTQTEVGAKLQKWL